MFIAEKPIATQSTPWLQLVLSQNYGGNHTLGRFRVMAVTGHDPLLGIPPDVRDVLALPAEKRSAEQTAALTDYYVRRDPQVDKLAKETAALKKRLAEEPVMNVRVHQPAHRRTAHQPRAGPRRLSRPAGRSAAGDAGRFAAA